MKDHAARRQACCLRNWSGNLHASDKFVREHVSSLLVANYGISQHVMSARIRAQKYYRLWPNQQKVGSKTSTPQPTCRYRQDHCPKVSALREVSEVQHQGLWTTIAAWALWCLPIYVAAFHFVIMWEKLLTHVARGKGQLCTLRHMTRCSGTKKQCGWWPFRMVRSTLFLCCPSQINEHLFPYQYTHVQLGWWWKRIFALTQIELETFLCFNGTLFRVPHHG